MSYVPPCQPGSLVEVAPRYEASPHDGPGDQGRPGLDQLLPSVPRPARPSAVTRSPASAENHKMMLEHCSQTKNLLVNYNRKPLGLF